MNLDEERKEQISLYGKENKTGVTRVCITNVHVCNKRTHTASLWVLAPHQNGSVALVVLARRITSSGDIVKG
jgi:hypothetical protein